MDILFKTKYLKKFVHQITHSQQEFFQKEQGFTKLMYAPYMWQPLSFCIVIFTNFYHVYIDLRTIRGKVLVNEVIEIIRKYLSNYFSHNTLQNTVINNQSMGDNRESDILIF